MKVLNQKQIMIALSHGKFTYKGVEYVVSQTLKEFITHNKPTTPNIEIGEVFPNCGGRLIVIRPGIDKNITSFSPNGPPDPGVAH